MAMTARTLVQKYLMGEFPASRDQLVDRAQRQGADGGIVALIRQLPEERFESAADVVRVLGHEHRGSRTSSNNAGVTGPPRAVPRQP